MVGALLGVFFKEIRVSLPSNIDIYISTCSDGSRNWKFCIWYLTEDLFYKIYFKICFNENFTPVKMIQFHSYILFQSSKSNISEYVCTFILNSTLNQLFSSFVSGFTEYSDHVCCICHNFNRRSSDRTLKIDANIDNTRQS